MTGAVSLSRAVVTGAGGFIGQNLAAQLRAAGVEVLALRRADCELRDLTATVRTFSAFKPGTVFHLAATGLSVSAANSLAAINDCVAMAENVALASPPGSRLVIAGSMSEYGFSGRMSEQDRCSPHTAYGLAKLAAGLRAAMIAQDRNVGICNARLFGVFGPGEAPKRLFPAVLAALRNRVPVALSDGLQWRDFVHVSDVCTVLMALASRATCPSIVNVGTGESVQIRPVLERLADLFDAPRELLEFGARSRSVHDEETVEADIRLLAEIVPPPPQRLSLSFDQTLFG